MLVLDGRFGERGNSNKILNYIFFNLKKRSRLKLIRLHVEEYTYIHGNVVL